MIGINNITGKSVSGFGQFVSRVEQVLTTPLKGREKRRGLFGCRLPELQGSNSSDDVLLLAQSYAVDAFYNEGNGISDFRLDQCRAFRTESGIGLVIVGVWNGERREFEVQP